MRRRNFEFSVRGKGGGASDSVVLEIYLIFELVDEDFGIADVLEACKVCC